MEKPDEVCRCWSLSFLKFLWLKLLSDSSETHFVQDGFSSERNIPSFGPIRFCLFYCEASLLMFSLFLLPCCVPRPLWFPPFATCVSSSCLSVYFRGSLPCPPPLPCIVLSGSAPAPPLTPLCLQVWNLGFCICRLFIFCSAPSAFGSRYWPARNSLRLSNQRVCWPSSKTTAIHCHTLTAKYTQAVLQLPGKKRNWFITKAKTLDSFVLDLDVFYKSLVENCCSSSSSSKSCICKMALKKIHSIFWPQLKRRRARSPSNIYQCREQLHTLNGSVQYAL